MADVMRARFGAQLLTGPPASSPGAVAGRLLAVQGQDRRGVRLAVRARTSGLSVQDFDHALADRSLLITWLCRGTLHLVRSEDYPWLQALTTPPLATGNARRLAQEGVSPSAAERGVAVIERALADEGPLTRPALRERVAAAGVRTEGQAMIHILYLTALRGLTVRGPEAETEQAYVLARDWLGELPFIGEVDRDKALRELARRYLTGHGPASDRDLARWAGLPLRDARAGLEGIAHELRHRDDGLADLITRPKSEEEPPPRLLGAFDPLLLGWVSRAEVLGERQDVVTSNGIFRPIALAGGKAVGTWGMPGGRVALEPFAPLAEPVSAQLAAEAADVERFLGADGRAGEPLPAQPTG